MKKFYFTFFTAIALCCYSVSFGQAIVFSDDFEAYTAGQQLACQNPVDWTTWTNTPCDPTLDVNISSNFAFSGSKSFVVVFNNDEVKPLGNATTGNWHISFKIYIPTGNNGYFNTLNQFSPPATYEWGLEVYFNTGGVASVNAGGIGITSFSFPYDTWIPIDVFVNLNSDQAELKVNNVSIITWQWTLGFNGSGASLMLGGNDFWGSTAQDEMYVDNYELWDLTIPVELTSFTANVNNLGEVILNWSTATETNNHMFEIERRTNNSDYKIIGIVEGSGTTTEPKEYVYTDRTVGTGTYYYRLKQIDFDGSYEYFDEIEIEVTGPLTFALDQNYPNPFNPSTKINYSIPQSGFVKLSVYNIIGEEVAVLVNGQVEAGFYEVTFNANSLPSGAYFYKLQSGNTFEVKKMLLTK